MEDLESKILKLVEDGDITAEEAKELLARARDESGSGGGGQEKGERYEEAPRTIKAMPGKSHALRNWLIGAATTLVFAGLVGYSIIRYNKQSNKPKNFSQEVVNPNNYASTNQNISKTVDDLSDPSIDKEMVIKTSEGKIVIDLLEEECPKLTKKIVELWQEGYYEGWRVYNKNSWNVGFGNDNKSFPAGEFLEYKAPEELGNVLFPTGANMFQSFYIPTKLCFGNTWIFARVTAGMKVLNNLEVGEEVEISIRKKIEQAQVQAEQEEQAQYQQQEQKQEEQAQYQQQEEQEQHLQEQNDRVDWNYWNSWEFQSGGWKILDNIAIKFNKAYFYDTVISSVETQKWYCLDVSIRALRGEATLDAYRWFALEDNTHSKTIDWLLDANGVAYGKHLYEIFNNRKLRPNPQDGCPSDIFTVAASSGSSIQRTLPFLVATTNVNYDYIVFRPELKGPIYLRYGNDRYGITNFDWHESWNKRKENNKTLTADEAIDKVYALAEVKEFAKGRRIGVMVEGYPTDEDPFYLIRVYEDLEDHIATHSWYKVNSLTGDVEDKNY